MSEYAPTRATPPSLTPILTAYTHLLIPDTTGGYCAEILEFPGCFAEGETAEDAMQALHRAAQAWIEAAQAQGQTIPVPLALQCYGGKIALRLPRSLHRQVVRFAAREGVSVNQWLLAAIAMQVGATHGETKGEGAPI